MLTKSISFPNIYATSVEEAAFTAIRPKGGGKTQPDRNGFSYIFTANKTIITPTGAATIFVCVIRITKIFLGIKPPKTNIFYIVIR